MKEGWRWFEDSFKARPRAYMYRKIPNTQYKVKIRAVTVNGAAPKSKPLSIMTKEGGNINVWTFLIHFLIGCLAL